MCVLLILAGALRLGLVDADLRPPLRGPPPGVPPPPAPHHRQRRTHPPRSPHAGGCALPLPLSAFYFERFCFRIAPSRFRVSPTLLFVSYFVAHFSVPCRSHHSVAILLFAIYYQIIHIICMMLCVLCALFASRHNIILFALFSV
jgi:hypothetical protein